MDAHILSWFEIPVRDFDRAKGFYQHILGVEMQVESLDGMRMAYFPFLNGVPTGCLTEDPSLSPSDGPGPLLYLNAQPDLNLTLGRVEAAGGTILQAKQPISPEYGYYALFLDTEGNKMGLISSA